METDTCRSCFPPSGQWSQQGHGTRPSPGLLGRSQHSSGASAPGGRGNKGNPTTRGPAAALPHLASGMTHTASVTAAGKCFTGQELQLFVPEAAWERLVKHFVFSALQSFKVAVTVSSFLHSSFGNHTMSHRDWELYIIPTFV